MYPRLFFVLLVFMGKTVTVFSQPIVYVRSDAKGRNNGSSWQNAYTDLGIAIAKTKSGQIWVARGIYLPSLDSTYHIPVNRRDATFHLHNGLQLYGGFAGSETTTSQRDFLNNATVLSGDYEQNDVQDYRVRQLWMHQTRQDNAYRVVNIVNADTVLLDGFIIQGGNTQPNRENPLYTRDSRGGGLHVYASRPTALNDIIVRNCLFLSNASWWGGGGLYHWGENGATSHLSLINCLFFNCQAVFAGGINNSIRLHSKIETVVKNCTFTRNYALYCGGGISTTIEPKFKPAVNRAIIRNSIFWGNEANGCRPDVDDYNAETSVWHSAMEYPYGGVGNFKMRPFFKNPIGADGMAGSSDDDFSIIAFCPDESRDSCLPPVIFNSFLIRGKPVQLAADLNRTNLVSLQAEENSFGIEVALVGFTLTPEKAVEYRLDGYDNDWLWARSAFISLSAVFCRKSAKVWARSSSIFFLRNRWFCRIIKVETRVMDISASASHLNQVVCQK